MSQHGRGFDNLPAAGHRSAQTTMDSGFVRAKVGPYSGGKADGTILKSREGRKFGKYDSQLLPTCRVTHRALCLRQVAEYQLLGQVTTSAFQD